MSEVAGDVEGSHASPACGKGAMSVCLMVSVVVSNNKLLHYPYLK